MSEYQTQQPAEPVQRREPAEPAEPVEGHEPAEPHDDGLTDPAVAAAVARLEGLAERPPEEHAAVYDEVHRVLQRSLAEAQTEHRPSPPTPPGS